MLIGQNCAKKSNLESEQYSEGKTHYRKYENCLAVHLSRVDIPFLTPEQGRKSVMPLGCAICPLLYSRKALKLYLGRSLNLVIAFSNEASSLAGGELEQNRYRQYTQVSRRVYEAIESCCARCLETSP